MTKAKLKELIEAMETGKHDLTFEGKIELNAYKEALKIIEKK